VVAVNLDTDQGEVAHVVSQYNFLAVPVVDSAYRLEGIVTVDDVIDVIREEATEEFLQMAGAGKDREILLKPVLKNAMLRAPWLLATWFGGMLNIFVISSFQHEIEKVVALAAFIPIIAGMAGSTANQSSTIVVRGLATGRVNVQEVTKLVLKELRVGLLLGVFFGLMLALVYYIGHTGMARLAVSIGTAGVCTMTIAATIGTMVPIVLRRLGVDAAIATVPFVSTSMDIISVSTYFFIAKHMLGL
jgi:magnesium transporter